MALGGIQTPGSVAVDEIDSRSGELPSGLEFLSTFFLSESVKLGSQKVV